MYVLFVQVKLNENFTVLKYVDFWSNWEEERELLEL